MRSARNTVRVGATWFFRLAELLYSMTKTRFAGLGWRDQTHASRSNWRWHPVPATKYLHHIKRLRASLAGGFLRSGIRGSKRARNAADACAVVIDAPGPLRPSRNRPDAAARLPRCCRSCTAQHLHQGMDRCADRPDICICGLITAGQRNHRRERSVGRGGAQGRQSRDRGLSRLSQSHLRAAPATWVLTRSRAAL